MSSPTPGRWYIDTMADDPRPWLFEDTGEHNCAGGGNESNGAHERHCGIEPVGPVEEIVAIASDRWHQQENDRRLARLGEQADAILAGDPDALAPRGIPFPF